MPYTLIGLRLITATGAGTYTPTSGTNLVIVELMGAGAGGGSSAKAVSVDSIGNGGSAGAYIRHVLSASFNGASYVVGAKGVGGVDAGGGSTTGHAGANGADTTFTDTSGSPVTYTAGGGVGGLWAGSGSSLVTAATAGGVPSNGDIQEHGGNAIVGFGTGNIFVGWSGAGGRSKYSNGGAGVSNPGSAASAGVSAGGYGGGGGGSYAHNTLSGANGGDGSNGLIIIWEYATNDNLGALVIDAPAISGTGGISISGSGDTTFDVAAIDATGSFLLAGAAAVLFDVAAISGSGAAVNPNPGPGTIQFGPSAIAGIGAVGGGGNGTMSMDAPIISGKGVTSSTATAATDEPKPQWIQSPQYTAPPDGIGVAIVPNSAAWGNSPWVTVVDVTDASWLLTGMVTQPDTLGQLTVVSETFEVDVAVGDPGSEVVVDTFRGQYSRTYYVSPGFIPRPILLDNIATGSRVSVRLRKSNTTTDPWHIALVYYKKPVVGFAATTARPQKSYPSGTGNIGLTIGASAWVNSTWTQIVASAATAVVIVGIVPDTNHLREWEFDIGIGAPSSEVVVSTFRFRDPYSAGSIGGPRFVPLYNPLNNIPAGSRIAVRTRISVVLGDTASVSIVYIDGPFSGAGDGTTTGANGACTITIDHPGIDGSGHVGTTGIGTVTIDGSAIIGSDVHNPGTGDTTFDVPTTNGSGTIGTTGTGSEAIDAPAFVGTGSVSTSPTSTIAFQHPTLSGTGSSGVSSTGGSAAISFRHPTISGSSGIRIEDTDDAMAVIDSYPAGTAFIFATGIHRNVTITPRNGDNYTFETGAILNGSVLLTNPHGVSPWMYANQHQQGTYDTAGGAAYTSDRQASGHPEDVYFDGVFLQSVSSYDQGGPGKFYFDYINAVIYIWDDPTGHTVECSVNSTAIAAANVSALFTNATVEKYACITQTAAVVLGPGCVFQNGEVRLCHYAGIETGPGSQVLGSHIHHNGVFGFIGSGNPLIDNDEIDHNNLVGGDPFWGAGGSKWVYANGLVVSNNNSHDNLGPGFWTDINNINVTYFNNTVTNNFRAGIFHEISYSAVISFNTCTDNGNNLFGSWPTEANISVCDSPNVEIHHNICIGGYTGIGVLQDDRGVFSTDQTNGLWQINNLYIHDNSVTVTTGAAFIFYAPSGDYFTSRNNRCLTNTWSTIGISQPFQWNGALNLSGFHAAGQS